MPTLRQTPSCCSLQQHTKPVPGVQEVGGLTGCSEAATQEDLAKAMLTGTGLRPRLLRVPDTDLRTLARAVCAPDMLREDIGDVRLLAVIRPAKCEGQQFNSAVMAQRHEQK